MREYKLGMITLSVHWRRWRPVTHAQTWDSCSAVYRLCSLSVNCACCLYVCRREPALIFNMTTHVHLLSPKLWAKKYSVSSWWWHFLCHIPISSCITDCFFNSFLPPQRLMERYQIHIIIIIIITSSFRLLNCVMHPQSYMECTTVLAPLQEKG